MQRGPGRGPSPRVRKLLLAAALLGAGWSVLSAPGCASLLHRGPFSGRYLFETRCTRCHGLRDVRAYSDDQWRHIVERYGPEAGLTEAMKKRVVDFLVRHNDPGEPDPYEDREGRPTGNKQ